MNSSQTLTKDQFVKRLVNLCLRSGLTGFLRDETDQQIILKSAVVMMRDLDAVTEQEINQKLGLWIAQVCPIKGLDRVTLRRRLVDAGFLTRSSDGARYSVVQSGRQPGYFDGDVDDIDVMETIRAAREEMERRKREFLSRGKGA